MSHKSLTNTFIGQNRESIRGNRSYTPLRVSPKKGTSASPPKKRS